MKTKALFAGLILATTALRAFSAGEEPSGLWTNHIVNGSFELPLLPSGANHVVPASELAPWQTAEDALLVWASNLPNEQAADGNQHAEVVSLWQTVPTVPGLDYRLSFHHSPRPTVDSTLTVSINGEVGRTFVENGSSQTEFRWKRYGTNFTATTNLTTIRFDGVGVAGNAHIDDVRLERLPLSSSLRVSEVEFCWPSVASKIYQVQFQTAVTGSQWANLHEPISGNGETNCIKDAVPVGEPRRFYRVITVP